MILATALAVLVGATVACAPASRQEEPAEQPPTPDPALVAEALRFGGVVLPPGATVLAAESERGVDQLYRVAVQVDPESVPALLTESGFAAPLREGRPVFMPPVGGFDLSESTDVASNQDQLPPDGDRDTTVTREILVDRSDPAAPVIHLWLFTT